jgi:hypothetical protein
MKEGKKFYNAGTSRDNDAVVSSAGGGLAFFLRGIVPDSSSPRGPTRVASPFPTDAPFPTGQS